MPCALCSWKVSVLGEGVRGEGVRDEGVRAKSVRGWKEGGRRVDMCVSR